MWIVLVLFPVLLAALANEAAKGNTRRAAWGCLVWLGALFLLVSWAISTADGVFYFGML